jgi:hypothetical protein
VNPASPWLSRMRAAASRMTLTVSADRACLGVFRGFGLVVADDEGMTGCE